MFLRAVGVILGTSIALSHASGAEIRFLNAVNDSPVHHVRFVLTERDGRFVLEGEAEDGTYTAENLPKGTHFLQAEVPGYADLLGQPGRGRPILFSGNANETIAIDLVPTGQIAGTVSRVTGELLPGAMVAAFWAPAAGAMEAVQRVGDFARTDDRGRFRLYGLLPSTYLIAVLPHSFGPGGEVPVPVFAPGVAAPGKAVELHLEAGATVSSVAIVLPDLPVSGIHGRISTPQPREDGERVRILLLAGDRGGTAVAHTYADASGKFAFPRVAPGSYRVRAWVPSTSDDDLGPPPAAGSFAAAQAVAAIGVNDPEVDVQLAPVANVTLRLTPEDGAAQAACDDSSKQIELESVDGWPPLWERHFLPDTGGLEFRGVPAGEYRLLVQPGDSGCYLSGLTVGSRSAAPLEAFRIDGATAVAATLGVAQGLVHGRVRNSTGEASPATVALVPAADPASARFTRAKAQSGYEFQNVPPGEYLLLAVPRHISVIERDPRLAERPGATRIALAESSSLEVNLEVP